MPVQSIRIKNICIASYISKIRSRSPKNCLVPLKISADFLFLFGELLMPGHVSGSKESIC